MKRTHPSKRTLDSKLVKNTSYDIDGKIVNADDIIRIDGEQGLRFIFLEHVVNKENGAEWITCIEIQKGLHGPFRSFKPDRIRFVKGKKPRVVK